MPNIEFKQTIQNALKAFSGQPLAKAAANLFETLGYRSDKHLPITPNTATQFQTMFDPHDHLNVEKTLLSEWQSVDFLFQVTDEEILGAMAGQGQLFNKQMMDNAIIESYLFFAVGLKGRNYSRTQLAMATREINKIFPMPVMVLFHYDDLLTLAIITRRLNKRDASKDVLEKVTLIKDISTIDPHRAHIEILHDLSVRQLAASYPFSNFVELQRAWEKTLDTSELNKRFYRDVADWYFWATGTAKFPKDAETEMSVIRLITRLIFVWFIKEKGLVPDTLFDGRKLKDILQYNDPKKSDYYKAILQNLFFATLNTEMGERKFRGRNKNPDGLDQHHGISTVYRFEDYFKVSKEAALRLFAGIPFLNGGLFECLDKSEEKIYIDGFSDNPKNQPILPDELFFGQERTVDLSKAYGDERRNKEKVRGLIPIFESYKFTVEENTPIEEEIALDPELLGKVFENLLAAYNPETGTTARKQTGSFYTPREIVDYMVDEALIAYLESKLDGSQGARERLRHLLAYNNEPHQLSEDEEQSLISAIDLIKVLDPACGSGAFPMSMLHKLVFILNRLDPENNQWHELQKSKAIKETEKAYNIGDVDERRQRLQDIDETFESNTSDYGRKLYLIENCIYGVDIQPIAVQIAKLRFFISIVVEQKTDLEKPNLGIRPLPNLETKFVAANTLIGIDEPEVKKNTVISFGDHLIRDKRAELKAVRHKIFSDRSPQSKRRHRDRDKQLRTEIVDLLKADWGKEAALQLAIWDPYDQNTSAGFFDLEWMFGIESGFDIVIGNPPYIGEKGHKELFDIVKSGNLRKFYLGKMDYFYFFFHASLNFGKDYSHISFITTNYYLTAYGAKKLRGDFRNRAIIQRLINFNEFKLFENALGQHNMITMLSKQNNVNFVSQNSITRRNGFFTEDILKNILDKKDTETEYFDIPQKNLYEGDECYIRLTGISDLMSKDTVNKILAKIKLNGKALDDICNVDAGLHPGVDRISGKILKKYPKLNLELNEGVFVLSENEARIFNGKKYLKPLYKSSDIQQWSILPNNYFILYSSPHHEIKDDLFTSHISKFKKILEDVRMINNENINSWKYLRRGVLNEMIYTNIPKIVAPYRSNMNRFAYTTDYFYGSQDIYFITEKSSLISLKYLLALLNSKLYFYWLYYKGKRKGNALELYQKPLSEIPIKVISESMQLPFIELVDKIIAKKHEDLHAEISNLEREINQMVYRLYGLTSEEIKLVESN